MWRLQSEPRLVVVSGARLPLRRQSKGDLASLHSLWHKVSRVSVPKDTGEYSPTVVSSATLGDAALQPAMVVLVAASSAAALVDARAGLAAFCARASALSFKTSSIVRLSRHTSLTLGDIFLFSSTRAGGSPANSSGKPLEVGFDVATFGIPEVSGWLSEMPPTSNGDINRWLIMRYVVGLATLAVILKSWSVFLRSNDAVFYAKLSLHTTGYSRL
ncbi:hypothetical protein FPV67DRAFT_885607 [Lyophyllum atratum]|nr:hypothetical protein FPV67DRAFT_885607 [Lyophyllum atratum]